MRMRRCRKRQIEVAELNITAFMNLMVILVPFLLITAVFSRVAVLQLDMPAPGGESVAADEPQLQLEVTVRADQLEVADRNGGLLAVLPVAADASFDLDGLRDVLLQLKSEYPEATAVTLLLEPAVPYDALVQVMDTVRMIPAATMQEEAGELFPDISIGDAVAQSGNLAREGD